MYEGFSPSESPYKMPSGCHLRLSTDDISVLNSEIMELSVCVYVEARAFVREESQSIMQSLSHIKRRHEVRGKSKDKKKREGINGLKESRD